MGKKKTILNLTGDISCLVFATPPVVNIKNLFSKNWYEGDTKKRHLKNVKERKGEALGLQKPSLNLDAGTLTVRHSLAQIYGKGLTLMEPKSEKSHRELAIPPFTPKIQTLFLLHPVVLLFLPVISFVTLRSNLEKPDYHKQPVYMI